MPLESHIAREIDLPADSQETSSSSSPMYVVLPCSGGVSSVFDRVR